jgi:hypothetical protein
MKRTEQNRPTELRNVETPAGDLRLLHRALEAVNAVSDGERVSRKFGLVGEPTEAARQRRIRRELFEAVMNASSHEEVNALAPAIRVHLEQTGMSDTLRQLRKRAA